MPSLSREQREFLQRHKIPTSMVFDATGLRRKDWQDQMDDLGLRFAFGVGPCRRGNHTLRTRSGNCMQCEPANIAFANRHYDEGFVYLAYSLEKILIKVGIAKDISARISSLNSLGYAGASDWKILQSIEVPGAGEIEFAIHADLATHNVAETYLRDGNPVVCREVFRCDMHTALLAFNAHTGERREVDQEISQQFLEHLAERAAGVEDRDGETPQWILDYRGEAATGADDDESEEGEGGDENTPQWILDYRIEVATDVDDDESEEGEDEDGETPPWILGYRGEAATDVDDEDSEEGGDGDEDKDEDEETPQWILDYRGEVATDEDSEEGGDEDEETPQWILDYRDTPQWILDYQRTRRNRRRRR
jgi:hypothetical protein